MNTRTARLAGGLLAILSCAVLVAAALLYLGGGHAGDTRIHLTRASWLQQEAEAFTTPPQSVSSAFLAGEWQSVELPFRPRIALLRQAASGRADEQAQHVRVSWIRVDVTGPQQGAEALAIYGARIKTDGTVAVYINGRLAHRSQQNGPLYNSTRTPLWITLEPGQAPVKEILLRLEHTPRSQVALSSLWLGPADVLRQAFLVREWVQKELPALLSSAFMAVGLFALFVWFRRPQDIAYLLFFNLSATCFLRGLHFYVSLPIANNWFAWLTVNSLFWLVLAVHFFLRQLHHRPLKWLTRSLVGITALIGVLTTPVLAVLPNMPTVTPMIYPVAALMCLIASFVAGFLSWKHSSEGRLVVVGLLLCIGMGMTDWLLQNNFISVEGFYMGAYMPAVCFATFGVLLYRRYVSAIAEVEQANVRLAERLKAREAELEASHRRLRESELRQTISDERQRLMQDMHDGLGSSLIGAIRSVEHGKISGDRVAPILKDCLDDLKLTIDSMEPVDADLLLLLATLRFRLEPRLEGSGVRLIWEVREVPTLEWLTPSSALHILRIVQESIANILRHTRATEIRVATSAHEEGIQISIADNGAGFDLAAALASGSGRGLQNQQRRAAALNGSVVWDSRAAGTTFTLLLPLQAN
ncbi:ATP-binding protein [Pseudoduganella sp. R-43]|uniref:sensor histidine kinase n=1 Tax=Pseudoduganella sp. R-43 TaxID=3404063 RepID=UPI003CF162A9